MRDPCVEHSGTPGSPFSFPGDSCPWYLSTDILDLVFTRVQDGDTLGRCSAVCRLWSDQACAEKFWEELVARRWCHKQPKRVTNGPLATERSRFWKGMYKQWDKTTRQPSSSFSGDRFPAFAAYTPKKKGRARRVLKESGGGGGWEEGRAMRAGVWVTCRHGSTDCSVPRRDVCPMLAVNVTVQNFETHSITVWPQELSLRLKNGSTVRPTLGACEQERPSSGVLALFRRGEEATALPIQHDAPVTLEQWDFVVLGPYEFPMPLEVEYEPEALERADFLSVAFSREESRGRYGGEKDVYPKEVERRRVRASFNENMIWKHYTDVNGKFWVFSDRPNNIAGI